MLPNTSPTPTERSWAMLAHLSALLTVAAGVALGGTGAVAALLVPLALYVVARERSPYVAYHALQATAFQGVGGVACVGLALIMVAVVGGAWVVTGALSLALVGLLLVPLALLVTLLGVVGIVGLPVGLLACTLRGAYLAGQGQSFNYPWVGRLVTHSLAPAAPA